MIDSELAARLAEIEAKVDAAYKAAHRTQQYMFWTGVVTVAFIVFPLIGLAFVLPSFINTYTNTYPELLNNQPTQQSSSGQSELNLLQGLGL